MKQIIVLLVIFLNCLTLSGQKKYYVKAYHNSDFYQRAESIYNSDVQERLTTKHSISNFSRFSVAVGLENNDLYHEIELSFSSQSQPFEHESRVSKNERRNKEFLSFQYEINKQLFSRGNFRFSSGLGLNMYKSRTQSITGFPTVPIFPITDDYLGVTLNFIPRITYQISDRIYSDFNTKIGCIDFHSYKSTVHNVQIPEEQQKWVDETQTNLLPFSHAIRLGLAYVIK